jgi:L-asparagine transporter-like permease
MPKLLNKLEKDKISTNILLGKWISLIENLISSKNKKDIFELPTWVNAINILVVWQNIYIIIFEPVPSAIKINHPLLANTFHFFFEKLTDPGV